MLHRILLLSSSGSGSPRTELVRVFGLLEHVNEGKMLLWKKW
jgi:hypothetical protein